MSGLSSLIKNDAALFDAIETLTLLQIRPNGRAEVQIKNATSSALSHRQAMAIAGTVDLDGRERNFSLPVKYVGDGGVQRGDILVQSDNRLWEVVQCSLGTMGTQWQCLAREQL